MLQLLFSVIGVEVVSIVLLLFRSPLRKLLIMGLDQLKRGKAPIVLNTVGVTVLVVFASTVYTMLDIQRRVDETGTLNPTDQVLMGRHMLEATLEGFMMFLGLMIDRLHHYIRELRVLRKNMEALKKQNGGLRETTSGDHGSTHYGSNTDHSD